MKKSIRNIIIGTLFVFSFNCTSYKSAMYKGEKGIEYARVNAITDFVNTYKTPRYYLKKREGKPFEVFVLIREKHLNKSTFVLSILPEYGDISLRVEDSLGKVPRSYFPNRYTIENEKLFLWNDSITPLQKDVLNVMDKYGVLDSVDVKRELGLLPNDFEDTRVITFDDRLKSVNYFICKKNIEKYKKKITNKAFGYYDPPKLKCNTH